MADYTVTEAQIENLVIAKGYTDCVDVYKRQEPLLEASVRGPGSGRTEAPCSCDGRYYTMYS